MCFEQRSRQLSDTADIEFESILTTLPQVLTPPRGYRAHNAAFLCLCCIRRLISKWPIVVWLFCNTLTAGFVGHSLGFCIGKPRSTPHHKLFKLHPLTHPVRPTPGKVIRFPRHSVKPSLLQDPLLPPSPSFFAVQSRPLVRSAFCPKKVDQTSGLTLHPGCNLLKLIFIVTIKKLILHPKRPYIRGPCKRAPL